MPTRLKIITPSGIKFDEEVISIETSTVDGNIGIGGNIAPLVATLKNCTSYIRTKPGVPREEAIITGGLLYVEKGSVKIFTDYFEYTSKLNEDFIMKNKSKLEKKLLISTPDTAEYRKLETQLQREIQKLKALDKK